MYHQNSSIPTIPQHYLSLPNIRLIISFPCIFELYFFPIHQKRQMHNSDGVKSDTFLNHIPQKNCEITLQHKLLKVSVNISYSQAMACAIIINTKNTENTKIPRRWPQPNRHCQLSSNLIS